MLKMIQTLMMAHKSFRANFVGHTLNMCCPFHKEATPSFTLDTFKQTYRCYGCNKRGTVDELFDEIKDMVLVSDAAAKAIIGNPDARPVLESTPKKKKK